ncbi:MAG: hypothetical protein KIH01_01695 [Candidatus Freyarchaeota archaeon]|nr:hypothetical protein [Candidatus Jordarchaeia archaeon]
MIELIDLVVVAMIRKVLIIHRLSGVPLLVVDFNRSSLGSDDALLSGMLRALEGLAEELGIGEFSSFKTTDAMFLVTLLKHVLVALLLDHEDDVEYYKQFAVEIAWTFEATYRLDSWDGNVERFSEFREWIISMLEKRTWKEMQGNARELPEGVAGYVVYDKVNHRFWANLKVKVNIIGLINSWEATTGEVVEASGESLTYVSTKLKRTPFGVIGILYKSLLERDVERYKKLFEFITENADKTFLLVKETLKAAESLFGKEAVEEVRRNEGNMLLEVLSFHENPLTFLELVRRMSIRGVVLLK